MRPGLELRVQGIGARGLGLISEMYLLGAQKPIAVESLGLSASQPLSLSISYALSASRPLILSTSQLLGHGFILMTSSSTLEVTP